MANEVFSFKGIKPQKLKVDSFRQEILNELRKEGRDQQKVLNQTTSTWKGDKPKMESLIGLNRTSGASVLTGPTGNTKVLTNGYGLIVVLLSDGL